MTWPAPQPGLVIRYSYFWTREARAGREEGVKDRPCAIVLAVASAQDRKRVIVLPITHTAPQPPDEGIELPPAVKTRLGLDHKRSWVIMSEVNDFIWPGPDCGHWQTKGRKVSPMAFCRQGCSLRFEAAFRQAPRRERMFRHFGGLGPGRNSHACWLSAATTVAAEFFSAAGVVPLVLTHLIQRLAAAEAR